VQFSASFLGVQDPVTSAPPIEMSPASTVRIGRKSAKQENLLKVGEHQKEFGSKNVTEDGKERAEALVAAVET
jgi:hypothetical protein